jgi:competence protein ComEC
VSGFAVGSAVLGGAAVGLVATLAVGALLLVWATGTGGRPSFGLIVAVVAAAAVGSWRGTGQPEPAPLAWADGAIGVAGRVDSVPAAGRFQRFVLAVDGYWDGERRVGASGRLDVTAPVLPAVEVGDDVFVMGFVTPLDDHAVGYAGYLRSLDCGGTLFGRSLEIDGRGDDPRRRVAALRHRLNDVFGRAVPGDAGVLVAGLVTGDDHALSRERRDAFVRTGTSHLTAVSGSNVALLVTLASLGASGGRRRRLVWQVALVAMIWAYAVLVGLAPPATRAALVATGAVFAVRAGRRPDLLTLLVVSGALMVVVRPAVLWSVSFQLSLAASLGLVAVAGSAAPVGLAGWLRTIVVGTVAAQLATLPIQAAVFGEVSLVSVPANVAVAPLAVLAFPLAFVAGAVGLAVPAVGEVAAAVAALPVEAMLVVVDALGGRAGAVQPIERPGPLGTMLLALGSAALLCLWSRDGRRWLRQTVEDARTAGWRLAGTVGAFVAISLAVVGMILAVH